MATGTETVELEVVGYSCEYFPDDAWERAVERAFALAEHGDGQLVGGLYRGFRYSVRKNLGSWWVNLYVEKQPTKDEDG